MSKKDTIEVYIQGKKVTNVPRLRLDSSGLTKKQKEAFKKSVNKHIKELEKHFNEGGWDIDSRFIEGDILYDVLGFHISDYILFEVLYKLKCDWGYRDSIIGREPRFYLPENSAIFYNTSTNKLVVAKDYRDYKFKKNYEYIGRL